MSDSSPIENLKKKSLSAMIWSSVDIFMRRGLQFVVAIVLARLLSPEEFGTIALLYLFFGLANTFVDSGFAAALIQRQDITHTDESTVFWFNLSMSIIASILFWISAPIIAEFYGHPILIPLVNALTLSVVLNALGAIHMTLLTKRLDFKTPLKVGAGATIISGVVAIVMAVNGYGVWALAIQTITSSLVSTLLLWMYSPWRPSWEFSTDSARRLFGFGGYLMLAGVLDVAYNRLYTILIGKFFSVADLGFYARAETTKQIPVQVLSSSLARVAFPVFSAAAHSEEKLRKGARMALRGIMLINTPMMLGLMVTAENAVRFVFGEKWIPSVPFLQILCIAGVLWPLHVINLNLLKALGHSHLFFRLEVIKKIVGVGLIFLGMHFYGVIGIAWSQVIFAVACFFINSYYTGKFLEYGVVKQFLDFLPVVFVTLLMSVLVYFVDVVLGYHSAIILFGQIFTGVVSFFVMIVLFDLKAYQAMKDFFIKSRREV